jgi:predicted  nucleic acid-binding Zn-ribbon protein
MKAQVMRLPEAPSSKKLEQIRSELTALRQRHNALDEQRRELLPRLQEEWSEHKGGHRFEALREQNQEIEQRIASLNSQISGLRQVEEEELANISAQAKAELRELYHVALETYVDALQHALTAQVEVQRVVEHGVAILGHRQDLPATLHIDHHVQAHYARIMNYLETQR